MPQAGQFLVALVVTGVIISISIHKIDEGMYEGTQHALLLEDNF